MSFTLRNCPSIIFDCDGVILQSNQLKSDAFGEVLLQYDPNLVASFVEWHKLTGGVSRFEKFAIFFRDRLGVENWQDRTNAACAAFGKIVYKGLCECAYIPRFIPFLETLRTHNIPLVVNTGGAESEIRNVFKMRGLSDDFKIILGSPTSKHANMVKLHDSNLILPGTIYLGDSKLDFDLAQEFELHFIYIGYESEWPDGKMITTQAGGQAVKDYKSLLLPV